MHSERGSGKICTFYSYKGGVGRSMALANVAALLAKWGQRVLIIDWDLEAPGIEKYFQTWIDEAPRDYPGVIDLIEGFANENTSQFHWENLLLRVRLADRETIDIIPAGEDQLNEKQEKKDYSQRLREIDWEALFDRGLGNYLESLRDEWRSSYDFVLIDSRTGITDIGGICTIHLPDALISFFTTNEQSLAGVANVMERARAAHAELPVDRHRLMIVPVPSRDESSSEFELSEQWRRKFAITLAEFLRNWVPGHQPPEQVLDFLKIPYFPYWSFGERVPVLEERDPENPKTLAYAYQALAKLIVSNFDWVEAREGVKTSELAKKYEAQAEQAKLEAQKQEIARAERERALEIEAQEEEKAKAEREHALKNTAEFMSTRFAKRLQEYEESAKKLQLRCNIVVFEMVVLGIATASSLYVTVTFYSEPASPPEERKSSSISESKSSESSSSTDDEFIDKHYSKISERDAALYLRSHRGMAVLSSAGLVVSFIFFLLTRYDIRAARARQAVRALLSMQSRFESGYPGDNPAEDLKKFVDEFETTTMQWDHAIESTKLESIPTKQ